MFIDIGLDAAERALGRRGKQGAGAKDQGILLLGTDPVHCRREKVLRERDLDVTLERVMDLRGRAFARRDRFVDFSVCGKFLQCARPSRQSATWHPVRLGRDRP